MEGSLNTIECGLNTITFALNDFNINPCGDAPVSLLFFIYKVYSPPTNEEETGIVGTN